MALPRREEDDSLRDINLKRVFRSLIIREGSLAVQREQANIRDSNSLVDQTIEQEQQEAEVSIPIQKHPGESISQREDVEFEQIFSSDPIRLINPVKAPPIERTTVSRISKFRMGVPIIRTTTKRGAIPKFVTRRVAPKEIPDSAQGLPIEKRTTKNTPVTHLSLLDQFFNWLNAFLS